MDPTSAEIKNSPDEPSEAAHFVKFDFFDLIEDANDIIYTVDLNGRLTFLNKAAERITGYSRQEGLGTPLEKWLDPESRRLSDEMLQQKLGGCPRTTYEVTLRAKDGRKVFLEVSTRLLFRQGIPVGVQGIARDITGRKRAEVLERDRNRVLELVASAEPLENVLRELCQMVEHQLDGVRCSIFLLRNDRLVPTAGTNPPGSLREAQALLSAPSFRRFPIQSRDGNLLGELFLESGSAPAEPEHERRVLEAALRLAVVAIEQRQLTESLAYGATHDPLTGLPNRSLFERNLEGALAEAQRHGRALAVLFIDLDRFKQINDSLGHLAGDQVLIQAGQRLRDCLRRSDLLARMGGDEFTAVITDLSDARDAARVAKKLLAAFQAPFLWQGQELFVTSSIGISLFPRDGRDAPTLQRNADVAMYRAKSRGRNAFEFFVPELATEAQQRLQIENLLRKTLDKGEFQLYYHPQVDRRGRVIAFEALLVWNHPALGLTPPSQFIPIAEECGLIVPIDAWAIQEACRQCALWQRQGLPRTTVAVNISAVQFTRHDFVKTVAQALSSSGLDPTLLELELTENVVLRRLEDSILQMQRLRALGVSIAIDDFGTGYSSLSYLRRLPLDVLKMDQSFLHGVASRSSAMPLVEAIIALAHGLRLQVVAEGVETTEQFEALKAAGCDRFQGYLWGEPLNAEAAARLLAQQESSRPL